MGARSQQDAPEQQVSGGGALWHALSGIVVGGGQQAHGSIEKAMVPTPNRHASINATGMRNLLSIERTVLLLMTFHPLYRYSGPTSSDFLALLSFGSCNDDEPGVCPAHRLTFGAIPNATY
jgi:hypothetical protein